jgi:hypothetical protein
MLNYAKIKQTLGHKRSRGLESKMSKKKVHVAIVLDESGSMNKIRQEAFDGVNEQIDTIKQDKDKKVRASFVKFATKVKSPVFWNVKRKQLNHIVEEDYTPSGWTAMLDGVGKTIEGLSKLDDGETSFLVVVISDGMENHSIEYNYRSLANLIKQKQETGRWTFTYQGANQDLSKVAEQLNIPLGNMSEWESTPEGTIAATNMRSASTKCYLSSVASGQSATTSFYGEDSLDESEDD